MIDDARQGLGADPEVFSSAARAEPHAPREHDPRWRVGQILRVNRREEASSYAAERVAREDN
jgi:hypothetical protein